MDFSAVIFVVVICILFPPPFVKPFLLPFYTGTHAGISILYRERELEGADPLLLSGLCELQEASIFQHFSHFSLQSGHRAAPASTQSLVVLHTSIRAGEYPYRCFHSANILVYAPAVINPGMNIVWA